MRPDKQLRIDNACQVFTNAGFQFTRHNDSMHLQLQHGGEVIDYWPTTGKYQRGGSGVYMTIEPDALVQLLAV